MNTNINEMLDALLAGDTLLVRAIKTSNEGKVQLEFAERMRSLEGSSSALLGLLNASDERFNNGPRRAWMTAEITDIAKQMSDINVGDDAEWEHDADLGRDVLNLGIENPMIKDFRLRVKIVETLIPDEYQKENVETAAKRRGAEGAFITHGGKYIFSNTEVVPMKGDAAPTHTMLEADAPVGVAGAEGIVDETQEASL